MLKRIISGAQTGADRGGLVAGKALGLETGGFIPKGCRTELGSEPALIDEFGLIEHSSSAYPPRTEANVMASDGTVLFGRTDSPGTRMTIRFCQQHGKTYLVNPSSDALREWVKVRQIEVLNVAGNRERTNPGIMQYTMDIIVEAFK